MRHARHRLGWLLLALLAWTGPAVFHFLLRAQETRSLARLTFTKILEGSTPEYVEVTVNADGSGACDARKLSDPPSPRPFKLSPTTTQRLFELTALLNYFHDVDLESHKKVANLGRKALIYEKDAQMNRAEFNYTLRREAQELSNLFERIVSVEQHIRVLEYSIKYDHLSLPRELLQIQVDLDNRALADPELMVPQLEEIARNPRFLHLAQARAQNILQRIQSNN